MEGTQENNLASFQKFLNNICQSFTEVAEERDGLPIKIFNHHCLFEELEGEILDWCLRYLASRNCPPTLTSALCRSVAEEVLHSDLSVYEEESGKSQDEEEGEQENNKDNGQAIIEDDSKDIVFDAESLCAYSIEVLEKICKKWKDSLPKLPVPKSVHQTSFHEIKNTRRKMEDRHVILPDLNTIFNLKDQPQQSYYAVFDGHAGVDAAVYASCQLHCRLVNCESFSSNPEEALKCAYKITDEKFISKAQKERLKSGSTGVSVLIRNDNLHIAWLGDSQAVLVRNGGVVSLMDPHKPEREDERQRIENAGGHVHSIRGIWRVNLVLSVSRAIGDVSQKTFITSDADVKTVKMDGTEDYIVLACDGLWDMLEPEELPSVIHTHLQETKGDRSGVARHLVTFARDRGSSDNITVIVVFLRDDIAPPQIVTQPFNFGQSETQDPSNAEEENGQFGSNPGTDTGDKSDQSKLNGNDSAGNKSNGNVDSNEIGHKNCDEEEQCKENIDISQHGKGLCLSGNFEVRVDEEDFNIQRVHLENVGSVALPREFPLRRKEQVFILSDSRDENSRLELPKLQEELRSLSGPANVSKKEESKRRGSLTARNIPEEYRTEIQSWSHKELLEPLKEVNRSRAKRKHRKTKKDNLNKESTLNALRKVSRKYSQLDPMVWAFTGKSRFPLPNHKLNMAAKSSNTPSRVALATMYSNHNLNQPQSTSLTSSTASLTGDNTYLLEKLVRTKNQQTAMQDPKNIENVPVLQPVHDVPLSTFTVSSKNTSTTSVTNPPVISDKAKEWELLKASNQFMSSWRPRKQTRVSGLLMSEVPPTPLGHIKLTHPQSEEDDDKV